MSLNYEHLVGLQWEHGKQDCFQLLRRFYADNFGFTPRAYAYPANWWDVAPQEDYFTRLAQREGFVSVMSECLTGMKPGYALAISVGAPFATHCGVWIGGGQFLHHPHQQESRVERWAGRWAARTISVWSHPQAPVPKNTNNIDMIDLLPAHKRERYREILAARVHGPNL